MDKKTALLKLIDGNKRFTENNPAPKKNGADDRKKFINGQQPYAAVLACSDSRVSPEIIFDASFNELFVVRNAGNIATEVETASIEYALEHLGVKLVLIMGHEKCGAVKAACDIVDSGAEDCGGNFKAVFNQIRPSVNKSKDKALVECDNAAHTKQRLMENEIIKKFAGAGEVMIVCARYKIESGEVEFFDKGD